MSKDRLNRFFAHFIPALSQSGMDEKQIDDPQTKYIAIIVAIIGIYGILISLCSLTARNGYEVIFRLQQH